ncbi:MAG: hypothetical protein LAT76_07485 [Schleiferiaceae bacterium]|nr:hypothetical protein [Schleiferiaceae bacterium]
MKANPSNLVLLPSMQAMKSNIVTNNQNNSRPLIFRTAAFVILIAVLLPIHSKGQSTGQHKLGAYFQTGLTNFTTERGINSFFRADDPAQIYPFDLGRVLNMAKGAQPKINYNGNPTLGFGVSMQYINSSAFAFLSTGFQLLDYQTEQSFTHQLGDLSLLTHAKDRRYHLETTLGKRFASNFGLGFNFGFSRRVSKFDSHFLFTNEETTTFTARDPHRDRGFSLTFGASLPYFHERFTAELRYDMLFVSQFDHSFSVDNYFSYQSQFHHWSLRVTIPFYKIKP